MLIYCSFRSQLDYPDACFSIQSNLLFPFVVLYFGHGQKGIYNRSPWPMHAMSTVMDKSHASKRHTYRFTILLFFSEPMPTGNHVSNNFEKTEGHI